MTKFKLLPNLSLSNHSEEDTTGLIPTQQDKEYLKCDSETINKMIKKSRNHC